MFAVLFAVFVLTWAATRAGYSQKFARGLRLDDPESRSGRTASQVVANVGLAAAAVVVPLFWRAFGPLAACAAVAVMAEAAADTCSSELGKAFGRKTVLITNGRDVPPGTDGAVSSLGVMCAVGAATATAGLAAALGLLSATGAAWVALAAILGTLLDSLLGATLEQRRRLNNDAVNLFSTLAAAVLAACFCRLL